MRILNIFIAGLTLLIGAFAQAQEPKAELYDQISSLRLEIERLADAGREVIAQKEKMGAALESLARKIDQRKADRSQESILPDFALQNMLRQSQELSETLTLMNRELNALGDARRDRFEKLDLLYGQLVEKIAKEMRAAKDKQKTALVKNLTKLRNDRESIHKELFTPARQADPMETDDLLASDDPEELKERMDAVRDEQDRLRKRLAQLDKQITDTDSEMRLDREMRDFVEDHALFGEESRTMTVTKTTSYTPPGDRTQDFTAGENEKNGAADPSSDGLLGEPDDADMNYDATMPGGECSGGMCGTPDESGGG
ncbi:MAG: hypothetical protein JRJ19_15345, partial [Deltaproteobacteria bacterium]|nr:hypothetical protein [Deltaproteobacteria bacterium]